MPLSCVRIRFTILRLMAAVGALGVVTWLGLTAWRVHRAPISQIVHIIQDRKTGALTMSGHSLPPSFWSHYRRALLGQAWPGDYPCECRLNPRPEERELASAAESNELLPLFNRIASAYQKAMEHRGAMKSLAGSIAWDEKRVADLEAEVKQAASEGKNIHGAEGVRRAFLEGISANRKRLERHERLFRLYDSAARSPTLLTDPLVIEPN